MRDVGTGWKGVTGAIGVRAVGAGLAGAVVGFEETWVAGRAAGLHARGRQPHRPLEILTTDFRLRPFVHELCLQKWIENGSACAGFGTSFGKFTSGLGGFWAVMEAPQGGGETLLWSLM